MPVEHCLRGSFEPLTEMVGGGSFARVAGQWTDDTAMAICLAESLVDTSGFDAVDQMQRYSLWASGEYLGETGTNLDIGSTTAMAIARFQRTGDPYSGSADPRSAGNGSIMRIAPIPMYFYSEIQSVEEYAAKGSLTTHAAEECVDACRLLARMIWRALRGQQKEDIVFGDRDVFVGSRKIAAIARGDFSGHERSDIRGTGYVVESLEAAIWCFLHTNSFREAVLTAANLGDDADTTAAVCGQLAGAHYGAAGIPASWTKQLQSKAELQLLADRLFEQRIVGV